MKDTRITIEQADYTNARHSRDMLELLDAYACDPMGGGAGLSKQVKQHLIERLAERGDAVSLLAYTSEQEPVGLVNAFEGFSTFAAAPLINIHDVYIVESYRGKGILQGLFAQLEQIARANNCCKMTLEVLSNNIVAKRAYEKLGFSNYVLREESGHAVFWQKQLSDDQISINRP